MKAKEHKESSTREKLIEESQEGGKSGAKGETIEEQMESARQMGEQASKRGDDATASNEKQNNSFKPYESVGAALDSRSYGEFINKNGEHCQISVGYDGGEKKNESLFHAA